MNEPKTEMITVNGFLLREVLDSAKIELQTLESLCDFQYRADKLREAIEQLEAELLKQ